MSTDTDWRSSISSLTRYENIENVRAAFEKAYPVSSTARKDAFAIENEAYRNSTTLLIHSAMRPEVGVTIVPSWRVVATLDEYSAACQCIPQSDSSIVPVTTDTSPREGAPSEEPGICIGSYNDCHYVASGVTAEVYRSKGRALKVITETRNIEPHNPAREARILAISRKFCIPLLETFRDQEQRFVLVFPYMPLTLEALVAQGPIPLARMKKLFTQLFEALDHIHGQNIIHRDVKPSALLLESPDGPAYLSDFGTAWHPTMSISAEPADKKILDIGTGQYRAPEVLFGDRSYGPSVDMWGTGVMLAECVQDPPKSLFESRPAHEDGNQLGLILSIFKTMGSPTRDSWPEAAKFRTPPFDMYRSFEQREWSDILPHVREDLRSLVAMLVKYNSSRASASEALSFLSPIQVDM